MSPKIFGNASPSLWHRIWTAGSLNEKEKLDVATRSGDTACDFVCPEPFCGVSKLQIRVDILNQDRKTVRMVLSSQ
ncbi:hypothetical protein O3M35_013048 [Rhynocoris fuscipes]|uniref:Uncharacterized protein n=1 Tax=Rhynocoris fuscipes TaxID=488301 RepID=A0AAW1CIU7_9HEMI